MDRLTSMEVFLKVVEFGSFIGASEALNISRPMASKHVQRLEDDLGVRLLHRTTRKVSLTEAGHSFHARCQTIFDEIGAAVAEAGNLQVEPKGLLRLNAPLTFGRAHLTRAIAGFQEKHPGVRIDLTLNDRKVDIIDEGFDLAIRISILSDSSLIARKIAPCKMVLCAAPSYLNASGVPTKPADLAQHNCLIYTYLGESRHWSLKKGDEEISVSVDGDFRTNFGEAVVEAAAFGRGIVLEPSFTVAPYLADGRLVQILSDYSPTELGIYAVYPPTRRLPQKVRVFIDHLVATFGSEPYWDDV